MNGEEMKKCPYCAEEVPAKATKCRYCGEFLDGSQRQPYGAAPVQPPPNKLPTCLILVIVVVCAIPFIAILAAIAIPSMLSASRSANEAFIISTCTEVATAQEEYYEENNRYGTLEELVDKVLVMPSMGITGREHGYHFEVTLSEDGQDWSMMAWPENPGPSTKSYYIDTTGEVRTESYTSHADEKAGPDSPPIMDWDSSDWDD